MSMTFRNPANGYTVRVKAPGIWTLLFGPLYFASHGAWSQAVISVVVAICTVGLSWLVYPFFAPSILRNAYLRKGWQDTATHVSTPTA